MTVADVRRMGYLHGYITWPPKDSNFRLEVSVSRLPDFSSAKSHKAVTSVLKTSLTGIFVYCNLDGSILTFLGTWVLGSMSKFEDSRRKTTTVIDAWDSSQTGHYVSCRNRRCRCRQLCCSCLSKQCRLRLWHVILLLLIEAIIIIPIGIVVAMFGPFNTIPRYSDSEAEVTTTEPYKGTVTRIR